MRLLGVNDLDLLESLFARLERSPFYVKDAQLRYVAANQAMAVMCGVQSSRDLVGRSAHDFYPGPDAHRFEAIETSVLRTGQRSVTMLDFIPGRRPVWLVFSNHPLFDEGGATIGVAGTSQRLDRRNFEDRTYQRVLAATTRLQADPAAPLSIHNLSVDTGVSVAQLQRDFQSVFHMTLRQFLVQLRLAKARELLRGNLPIAQVAHDVGFADHSAFSRRFLTEFGITPKAFRELWLLQTSSGRPKNE